VKLKVELYGDLDPLVAFLEELAIDDEEIEKLEDAILAILRRDVLRQVAMRGDPPWAPLSASTIEYKQSPRREKTILFQNLLESLPIGGSPLLSPDQPLVYTGALLQSWIDKMDDDHIEGQEGDEFYIGTEIEYAAKHQYGYKKIPARPFRVTEDAIREVIELLESHGADGL
jgi:phage gpG-like protein